MLNPETWNFKPPVHNFSVCPNDSPQTEISNHYFNHSVTVVLPDTLIVPENLNTVLINDSTYYKAREFPVHKFLDEIFIESFVKTGRVTALSVDTGIDSDDCVALTPSGHLVLNLLKETYQSLGLQGSQSTFSSERFVVQLDLKKSSFTPGKKNYEKTVKCLTEFCPLQMDFIMFWEPPEVTEGDGLVCPSSIAAYLIAQGVQVSECTPKLTTTRQYNVRLPLLASVEFPELLEWLGAVAFGVDMNREDAEGGYLSSYRGPLETSGETQVAVLTFQGLFTPKQINQFFSVFNDHVKKRSDGGWAAMHVQGFADSPVSWGLREHTFHGDGNNDYTILLQSDGISKLVRCTAAPRKMKFKLG